LQSVKRLQKIIYLKIYFQMAENKKSFLLYCDLIHTVKHLPKDKAGELFLHILEYVNDLNPQSDDLIINLSFEPIKQSLKRDLIKYESIIERNKVNGKKGGRPNNPNNPVGLLESERLSEEPKKADSVSDSVIDSDSVTDKDINYIYIESEKIFEIKNFVNERFKLQKTNWQTLYPLANIDN
jgi:hypothetical protein